MKEFINSDYEIDSIYCLDDSFKNSIKISNKELERIKKCSIYASNNNLEVHAGHGLDYKTTRYLSRIHEIEEFNIGHFLIGESIFEGLPKVIKRFRNIIKKK